MCNIDGTEPHIADWKIVDIDGWLYDNSFLDKQYVREIL